MQTQEAQDRPDEFYLECRAYVERLARRMFGRREAEDITQEVMVRLVRSMAALDLDQPIKPWLATVTRNVGISAARARRELVVEDAELEEAVGREPDQPSLSAERSDQRRFVHAALRRLSPRDAELLRLHEFDDLSLSEIARRRGVESNAVRQGLFRARRRFSSHYRELGGPQVLLWPALVRKARDWTRVRVRLSRRAGLAGGCAALALLAASLIGDGEQRLLPFPVLPVPGDPSAGSVRPEAVNGVAGGVRPPLQRRTGGSSPAPDDVSWYRLKGAEGPPPRRESAMVYDEARQEYVLFGGLGSDGDYLGDTWTSPDGGTWTLRSTVVSPAPRRAPVMVFDSARAEVVLYGGATEPPRVDLPEGWTAGTATPTPPETWTWDGLGWTRHDVINHPPRVLGASFAYDPARRVAILFGGALGIDSDHPVAQTWAWNGETWTEMTSARNPSPREGAAMSYDGASGQLLLFGGFAAYDEPLGDTWTWDGADWRALSPAHSPPARALAGLVDTGLGPILHGGLVRGRQNAADTWNWTGTDWSRLDSSTPPSPVCAAAFAFRPATGELLLMSGDTRPVSRRVATDRLDQHLAAGTYVGRYEAFRRDPGRDLGAGSGGSEGAGGASLRPAVSRPLPEIVAPRL